MREHIIFSYYKVKYTAKLGSIYRETFVLWTEILYLNVLNRRLLIMNKQLSWHFFLWKLKIFVNTLQYILIQFLL